MVRNALENAKMALDNIRKAGARIVVVVKSLQWGMSDDDTDR